MNSTGSMTLILPLLLILSAPPDEQEAMAFLERTLLRYREADTYQDRVQVRMVHVAEDEQGQRHERAQKKSGSFTYGGADRIAMDLNGVFAYCDREQLWMHVEKEAQYTEPRRSLLVGRRIS